LLCLRHLAHHDQFHTIAFQGLLLCCRHCPRASSIEPKSVLQLKIWRASSPTSSSVLQVKSSLEGINLAATDLVLQVRGPRASSIESKSVLQVKIDSRV
jgi:hypothetical protein